MAYFSPFIDESGIHVPTYNDIKNQLIDEIKGIYGNDIYLDPDSADYQFISIFAKKIFDSYSLAVTVYNNRTPITAIGVGLDNCVAYADIRRKQPTNSTVQLTITGAAGTVLSGIQAIDQNGYRWNIPDITIPENGTIIVEATCEQSGNIGALPNTINIIGNPTFGLYSITNQTAASPGADMETDAELRGRYSLAIRSPSSTVFESMIASISEISGVTRVKGYENDTGNESTGSEPPNLPAGFPAHSVTFVVEGGEDNTIAEEIYFKKTPGCYTNGTTEVNIISISGNVDVIRFYRPTYTPTFVKVTLKKLPTWNDEYTTKVKNAINEYINNLNIADDVYRSMVWSVAVSALDDISNPAFSVTNVQLGTSSGSETDSDIDIAFNAVAQSDIANISVVVS